MWVCVVQRLDKQAELKVLKTECKVTEMWDIFLYSNLYCIQSINTFKNITTFSHDCAAELIKFLLSCSHIYPPALSDSNLSLWSFLQSHLFTFIKVLGINIM